MIISRFESLADKDLNLAPDATPVSRAFEECRGQRLKQPFEAPHLKVSGNLDPVPESAAALSGSNANKPQIPAVGRNGGLPTLEEKRRR
uniref:Uncharacterized protein n=1 Tax=Sphaerodactylus townsendi TaxID=933632 RepID=A0ACB8F0N0_9SAUR